MDLIIDILLAAGLLIFILFVGAVLAAKKNKEKDQ